MLAAHNARERSVDEYTELFKAASPGFSYVGTSGDIPGVYFGIVEYRYSKQAP